MYLPEKLISDSLESLLVQPNVEQDFLGDQNVTFNMTAATTLVGLRHG